MTGNTTQDNCLFLIDELMKINKEVGIKYKEKYLIKLAEKKGFKIGAKVIELEHATSEEKPEKITSSKFNYYIDEDDLWVDGSRYQIKIYESGQWATIIEEKPKPITITDCIDMIQNASEEKKQEIIQGITKLFK